MNWNPKPENLIRVAHASIKKSSDANEELINSDSLNDYNLISIITNDINECTIIHNTLSFLQFVHPDSRIRAASQKVDIMFADHFERINNDKRIYDKIVGIRDRASNKELNYEEQKLIDRMITIYEKNGINLEKRNELLEIKNKINRLELKILTMISNHKKVITLNREELYGLPDYFINSLKRNGNKIDIELSSLNYDCCMKFIDSENTRKKIESFYSEQYNDISQELGMLILLRDKRAKMLNYETHSSYKSSNQMANNSDNIRDFLIDMLNRTDRRYKKEIDTLINFKKECTGKHKLSSWDFAYYLNKLKQMYGVDEIKTCEYFELKSVVNKIMEIYEEMFKIKFVKEKNVKVWDSDVDYFKVYEDKKMVGEVYLDLFARPGKYKYTRCFCVQPGCLVSPFEKNKYCTPTIALVCQFPKVPRVLLNHKDVISLFHEFGHIMQDLFIETKFTVHNSSNIECEFVQAPAHVLDLLCWEKDILKKISCHCQTKKQLPDEMLNKLIRMRNLDIGIHYKKQIMIALFDQFVFASDDFIILCKSSIKDKDQIQEIFNGLYKRLWMEVMNRENSPIMDDCNDYFVPVEWLKCVTSNDAQYYADIWCKVLSADIFMEKVRFEDNLSNIGDGLRKGILRYGSSLGAYKLIWAYLGRAPIVENFLKLYSFDQEAKSIKKDMSHNKRREKDRIVIEKDDDNLFTEINQSEVF